MNKEQIITAIATSNLLLVETRLSPRADAEKVNINGRDFNVTKENDPTRKPRLYFLAVFADPTDPFGAERVRVITQQYDGQGNPIWRQNPNRIFASVGKLVRGAIVTHDVEPFQIRPDTRPAKTYTTVVFPQEDFVRVMLNSGRVPTGLATVQDLPPRFIKQMIANGTWQIPAGVATAETQAILNKLDTSDPNIEPDEAGAGAPSLTPEELAEQGRGASKKAKKQ